ncbi:hypothetical protein J2Z69_001892 [Paenibacillus shirakamiensis]|uniref:SnoaL-like domain-containing protein n=1 Tax=Paenibacillus shirakamiensis TaxID=1265935 RepID=A0ABS4JIP2_9BACL|nr:nuclear transport factor 2 family protein [Paenibacillus shirakamiensis]MBP2000861.1 hypothetical protein [Paenibacillus shirakamiensis]
MHIEVARERIERYIEAYNSFNVEGMVNLLHKDILFRNFSDGALNLETQGIEKFRELAESSAQMFSSRHQTIVDYKSVDDRIEVQINYEGRLAVDLPSGLKAGETMQLHGKSIFELRDGKILLIEDYS